MESTTERKGKTIFRGAIEFIWEEARFFKSMAVALAWYGGLLILERLGGAKLSEDEDLYLSREMGFEV